MDFNQELERILIQLQMLLFWGCVLGGWIVAWVLAIVIARPTFSPNEPLGSAFKAFLLGALFAAMAAWLVWYFAFGFEWAPATTLSVLVFFLPWLIAWTLYRREHASQ